MIEETEDLAGAEVIEDAIADGMVIGTILKRDGAYYFTPAMEHQMVLGSVAINKIANRINELGLIDAQLHRQTIN